MGSKKNIKMLNFYLIVIGSCFIDTLYAKSQPNILFILADDLGWANVGFHRDPSDPEVVTPNIDKLATEEGLQLNRHYVYFICAPTRSSFQSGRLPVHVNTADYNPLQPQQGIPQNMTALGSKMKEAGYSTHIVGKWDVGLATMTHTPSGRGYDTSLVYYNAEIDYWKHTNPGCQKYDNQSYIDLWENNEPAYEYNTSEEYVELIFAKHVYDLIDTFNEEDPFFLVYTPHIVHAPLQVPEEYYIFDFDNDENGCKGKTSEIWPGFNDSSKFKCRTTYHAMVTLLDEIIGNITNKLKAKNLWDNTLVVFSSDNGGPLGTSCCGGNNYPLRGGKHSVFEGGVRVSAFVSGGYLPENRRNKIENGIIHVCDWYSTFCALNGIDPDDSNAAKHGLPPIDSVNVWPLIIGENTTSPRTEYPINFEALIQGNYKYIAGKQVKGASWAGQTYPNASSPDNQINTVDMNCDNEYGGCLFDVVNDPNEHNDISSIYPNITKKLNQRLTELMQGFYNNSDQLLASCNDTNLPEEECSCQVIKNHWKGFYGPYCLNQ